MKACLFLLAGSRKLKIYMGITNIRISIQKMFKESDTVFTLDGGMKISGRVMRKTMRQLSLSKSDIKKNIENLERTEACVAGKYIESVIEEDLLVLELLDSDNRDDIVSEFKRCLIKDDIGTAFEYASNSGSYSDITLDMLWDPKNQSKLIREINKGMLHARHNYLVYYDRICIFKNNRYYVLVYPSSPAYKKRVPIVLVSVLDTLCYGKPNILNVKLSDVTLIEGKIKNGYWTADPKPAEVADEESKDDE